MLPIPTLSATIDRRGNVTIAGWSLPARPRAVPALRRGESHREQPAVPEEEAVMALASLSQTVVDEVMTAGGHRCAECRIEGRRVRRRYSKRWCVSFPTSKPDVYLSIDQERSNLRILCTTCNTRRGAAPELRPTLAPEEHW